MIDGPSFEAVNLHGQYPSPLASGDSSPSLLGRQKVPVLLKLQFGCLQMAEKHQKGNNNVIKDNDQSHHCISQKKNHLSLKSLFQCYL